MTRGRAGVLLITALLLALPSAACSKEAGAPTRHLPLVLDVHRHIESKADLEETLEEMKQAGVVHAWASGSLVESKSWRGLAPDRVSSGVLFPCPGGKVPLGGPQCFSHGEEFPTVASIRHAIATGRASFIGEVTAEYAGLSPSDPLLERYYALAEELDVPVGIHLSLAPPGTPYQCCPEFRSAMGNPLLLEPVLARHPRLRIWVMHAGYPYLEEMKAVMLVYPRVYVDVAAIDLPFIVPRAEFYHYLEGLMRAGLGKRIMFGSDYSPIATAIDAIEKAPFLSAREKRDILYDNAARFFRLEGARRGSSARLSPPAKAAKPEASKSMRHLGKQPPASGREPAGEPYQVGGEVTKPVKISGAEPDFSGCRSSGNVILISAIIDRSGKVGRLNLLRGDSAGCAEQRILRAISKWRFRPARLHGKPVAVVYNMTVNIDLQ